ncbi:cytochrome C peroxidase [beta proteobacterium AAP99]|nr:cytochrome C peroxidase [beta proteobacterium AAP99]
MNSLLPTAARCAAAFVALLSLSGVAAPPLAAQQSAGSFYAPLLKSKPKVEDMAELGRVLFMDKRLSASGQVACASCHDPARAFGPPVGLSIARAGADGRSMGLRAVPSLRYRQTVPPFTLSFHEGEADVTDQGPAGGHTWDGRAGSAHEQARLPLFSPLEMANRSPAELLAKVRAAGHGAALERLFGADLFKDEALALNAVLLVLEVYQQTPASFSPFSSKYDAVLRGQTQLSAAEARGLELFRRPDKGNCALCHVADIKEGAFPLFTDWGYVALGVPRNRALAANRNPAWFDLGLCGPLRTDLQARKDLCGQFRTPSLRNVALREQFFHNGAITGLEAAVRFYATRDTDPAAWYPAGRQGAPRRFDDMPAQYHGNVTTDPPFDRHPGQRPALSAADVRDIVAFLKTLTDADAVPAAVNPTRGKASTARAVKP